MRMPTRFPSHTVRFRSTCTDPVQTPISLREFPNKSLTYLLGLPANCTSG